MAYQGEDLQSGMHMFNPNCENSTWKSPFPKTFGTHDHNWPDLFFSLERIKQENTKRYRVIDGRFQSFDIIPE